MLQRLERDLMLQLVDQQWKDHLYSLDHLKEGIGLRGYGQRDPLVEYKKESFAMFQAMKERVDEESVRYLWGLRPVITEEGAPGSAGAPDRCSAASAADHEQSVGRGAVSRSAEPRAAAERRAESVRAAARPQPARVGRRRCRPEDGPARRAEGGPERPCPCGSGKKYKKCHGATVPTS